VEHVLLYPTATTECALFVPCDRGPASVSNDNIPAQRHSPGAPYTSSSSRCVRPTAHQSPYGPASTLAPTAESRLFGGGGQNGSKPDSPSGHGGLRTDRLVTEAEDGKSQLTRQTHLVVSLQRTRLHQGPKASFDKVMGRRTLSGFRG
jgi:hypothetical protein